MIVVTEFNLWDTSGLVPQVEIAGNPEFETWEALVPTCDVGAELGGNPSPLTGRRLVFILN